MSDKGLMELGKDTKNLMTRARFDEPTNFEQLMGACKILVASRILPKEIDTAEKCAVVVLTGRELGLQMMAATRGIYIVNNRPALSAQMMLALAHNTGELEDYQITESGSGEKSSCTVMVKRKGKTPYVYTFSVDMIKKMGKHQNEWLKQPENMCKQRAISGNMRVTFPDAILGMYTPEEAESIPADVIDTPAVPIVGLKHNNGQPGPAPAAEKHPETPENVKKPGEPLKTGAGEPVCTAGNPQPQAESPSIAVEAEIIEPGASEAKIEDFTPSASDLQTTGAEKMKSEIRTMLEIMHPRDQKAQEDALELNSTFITKEGKTIKGVRNLEDPKFTPAWALSTHRKLKNGFSVLKKEKTELADEHKRLEEIKQQIGAEKFSSVLGACGYSEIKEIATVREAKRVWSEARAQE